MFNKTAALKVLGLLAAFTSCATAIVNGDIVTGVGIIGAALSSANLKNSG